MNNKNRMIEALKNARKSHKLQMGTISSMINGDKVTEKLELDKNKCEFGKWLYNDTNRVKSILGSQFYAILDDEHTRWHSECQKISDILAVEKKGVISKLLGSEKPDHMRFEKAEIYYAQLELKTEELLKILTSSERRLVALHESKFDI